MFRKNHGSKAKKRVLGLLALALVAVIGVGSGLAYLTDYDLATNKFTLGDEDITLEEPNWKNPVKAVTQINGRAEGKQDRNGDEVVVGDVLTYAVTATNGDIEAHDIIITDVIEDGLTVDESSISSGGTYNSTDRKITWTITNVAKLTDVTVYFKATVNENAVQNMKVDNDAWAKVGTNDAKQTNLVSNPLTEDPHDPTKKVSNTSENGIGGATVTVGAEITYEIICYNDTDAAGTVTVTDPLDEQVSYVASSDGGVYTNGDHTVRWTFTNMPAHSSKTITLTVKVETVTVNDNEGHPVLDQITNQAKTEDPENSHDTNVVKNPTNKPDEPIKPEKHYDASTAAGMDGAKVNVGDVITYKIQYYNHENEAVDVVITDTIDAGLTVDEASISNGGTYDANTGVITWTITNVPANTYGSVTFEAAVNEAAVVKVVNDAYVQIGENNAIKTNKLTNPTTETTKPGDTDIKDPTVTGVEGDGYLRMVVQFQDADGNLLTDAAQINKIIDTIYYDTSYVAQGTVADPSQLTSNLIKGESYSSGDLAALVASGAVIKEYNNIDFEYDTTRTGDVAIRFYNYIANDGIFADGSVATLFTNAIIPSDWTSTDIEVLGQHYIIKIMAQACQVDNLTQEQAYDLLDDQAELG